MKAEDSPPIQKEASWLPTTEPHQELPSLEANIYPKTYQANTPLLVIAKVKSLSFQKPSAAFTYPPPSSL